MNMEEQLRSVVDKATADGELWHTIIHGTVTTEVPTENGKVPTVAKQLKDVRDAIVGGVIDVVSRAETARDIALEAQSQTETLKSDTQSICDETLSLRNEAEGFKNQSQSTFNNIVPATNAAILSVETVGDGQVARVQATGTEQVAEVVQAGTLQTNNAKEQADRATAQANLVNYPIVAREENSGNIIINWGLQEDYLFYLTGNASLSFENLPDNDNTGWFRLLVFSVANTPTLTVPSNFMYADGSAPVLKAGKCYQFAIQYLYVIDKFFVSVVEY